MPTNIVELRNAVFQAILAELPSATAGQSWQHVVILEDYSIEINLRGRTWSGSQCVVLEGKIRNWSYSYGQRPKATWCKVTDVQDAIKKLHDRIVPAMIEVVKERNTRKLAASDKAARILSDAENAAAFLGIKSDNANYGDFDVRTKAGVDVMLHNCDGHWQMSVHSRLTASPENFKALVEALGGVVEKPGE